MRNRRKAAILLVVPVLAALLSGCSGRQEENRLSGQIFLLGEAHSNEQIYQKELEIWSAYYHEYGLRDLFVELPSFTAGFLNLWMQAEDDELLDAFYADIDGTASHVQAYLDFWKGIKAACPETVFHGTDVGHQFDTTGERFLEYLASAGRTETEEYRAAQEVMEQGMTFYENLDWAYREEKMTENFIRELESLDGAGVAGIYGAFHTQEAAFRMGAEKIPSLAGRLQEKYGDALHTRNLADGLLVDSPCTGQPLQEDREEPVAIGDKTYPARYIGKVELGETFPEYQFREFWLLEEAAYEDVLSNPVTGVLPCDNYPEEVVEHRVYAVDCTRTDGSVERSFYRSDIGIFQDGRKATRGFAPSE